MFPVEDCRLWTRTATRRRPDRRREPGRDAGQCQRCALSPNERFAHWLIPAAASEHEEHLNSISGVNGFRLALGSNSVNAPDPLWRTRVEVDSGLQRTGGARGAIGTYTAAGRRPPVTRRWSSSRPLRRPGRRSGRLRAVRAAFQWRNGYELSALRSQMRRQRIWVAAMGAAALLGGAANNAVAMKQEAPRERLLADLVRTSRIRMPC